MLHGDISEIWGIKFLANHLLNVNDDGNIFLIDFNTVSPTSWIWNLLKMVSNFCPLDFGCIDYDFSHLMKGV